MFGVRSSEKLLTQELGLLSPGMYFYSITHGEKRSGPHFTGGAESQGVVLRMP